MTQVRERKSSSSSIVSRFGKRGFAGLAAGSTLAVVAAVSAGAWWMSAGPTTPATAARTINVNDVFNVDAVHSSVVFSVSYAEAAPFFGRFNTIGGSFFLDEANAAASSVEIRLDPASVDSNNQGRDRHLRNADFFNVGEFNTLAFKSKQVRFVGENKFEVQGDLTMHGQTRPLTVTLTKGKDSSARDGKPQTGFSGTFTVRRSDFGMNYMVGQGLGDEVTVMLGIVGTQG